MHLIIVGRGKMARLFQEECQRLAINCTNPSELPLPLVDKKENPIVIHVGSGRFLLDLIVECGKHGYPLVQASSGQMLPDSAFVPIPVINAPNLGLLILALLDVMPRLGTLTRELGAKVEVAESHQASKTSPPITAQIIAGYFGNPSESVNSIRNTGIQTTLGVPTEYLDGHAYHFINIKAHGVEAEITFKVHGRKAYFLGAVALAQKMIDMGDKLTPGIYSANKIVFA